MKPIRAIAMTAILLAISNGIADACASCFQASTPGTLRAYYISTAILSAMPLAIIVTFGVLLFRRQLGSYSDPRKAGDEPVVAKLERKPR